MAHRERGPRLCVMLDTGHVNVTARAIGLDPTAYWAEHIEKLGARLQHLHLDGNLGDLDSHVAPGDGNFDFKSAFASLKRSGYAGWLSAEIGIFGANPIPPAPKDILRRTHDTVSRLWAEA
ncbi:MAG TPA: sugar phosphate isomerase/epimerase [Roseiarcus sp.]